ncbi:MAG: hypothetical protein M1825_000033 [Sarcosagium campestre]|nr:MAG: hypothetical protein M1825_000033 [Sarcosagium campestre]
MHQSHDTMLAWYEDMRNLTEKSGEERNTYVRRHARSMSAESQKAGSISSDGAMEEDEADEIPYSATASSINQAPLQDQVKRPQPGGRFPSDFQVDRGLQATHSASSASSYVDGDLNPRIQPVSKMGASNSPGEDDQNIEPRGDIDEKHTIDFATVATSPYSITSRTQEPTGDVTRLSVEGPRTIEPPKTTSSRGQFRQNSMQGSAYEGQKHDSLYGDWMAPVHQTGGQPIAGSQRFVQSDGNRSDTAEARSSGQVGQPLDGEGIPPHEEKSTGTSVPVKATSESIIPGFPTPDEPKTTQLGSMFGSNDEQQLSQDSGADPVVTDGPDKTTTTSAAKRPGPAHKSSSYYKVPGDFPSTGERTLKIDK